MIPILRGKYTEDLPAPWDAGELMTKAEYLQCVDESSLMDDDGYGHPILNDMMDGNLFVYPSQLEQNIPIDATHIIWFNK